MKQRFFYSYQKTARHRFKHVLRPDQNNVFIGHIGENGKVFQKMTLMNEPELLTEIGEYLPARIKQPIRLMAPEMLGNLEEIRIKAGMPLMGVFCGCDYFICEDGSLKNHSEESMHVSVEVLNELFLKMCEHSIYAYQEDIARGFITLKGGHRAGICGTVIYQGQTIRGIKEVSSICIRISRQLRGCAGNVFLHIKRGFQDIYNTLIISPPRCGKTTLLRDLCRLISEGSAPLGYRGLRSAVIDERSELGACYKGIPQNDLGPRTDILDGCRKPEGIEMALRGMSPAVIVVDELGSRNDAESIRMAWNAGVRIVATAHAYDLEDFQNRLGIGELAGSGGFERYIVIGLNQGERVFKVMDADGNQLNAHPETVGIGSGVLGINSHWVKAVGETQGEAACASEAQGHPADA